MIPNVLQIHARKTDSGNTAGGFVEHGSLIQPTIKLYLSYLVICRFW